MASIAMSVGVSTAGVDEQKWALLPLLTGVAVVEQLDEAERRILHKAHEHQVVSTNAEDDFQSGSTLGERLADGIARVGGSWYFIIAFLLFLVVWAIINTLFLTRAEADEMVAILVPLIEAFLKE